MYEAFHNTPLGFVRIRAEERFITSISIRDEECVEMPSPSAAINLAIKQLDEYFAGKRKEFDLPMNQPGTDFQKEVWKNLLTVKYGSTMSYLQLANQMNNPLAIRAIAASNGKNMLWIVVPCHRIIGSNGSLTGYAGGLWRKQWLLEHEAHVIGIGQTKLPF
ncbi:methylated-DNA--[protein]-cysteine S-methyltransferase [Mucilaginibacter psychrotolerans]|uniref:Methylated-DNA--protein-cysteine methyltransferase n=1 Tax=Mucilaginibacter psychrotolerans TaxID=1524096 RepID=A0A4Y8SCX0_9SPHI|nr:methylated-DNA--[protein]-cysteine S-methyltransferase [Mucilaginibacter psychrotolerans]TFF36752.1 methylated-DNA--[protein]-cysteine S-methyltransferase [Mucilaginibacter psychrotolerans]